MIWWRLMKWVMFRFRKSELNTCFKPAPSMGPSSTSAHGSLSLMGSLSLGVGKAPERPFFSDVADPSRKPNCYTKRPRG
jgi:hypothetical protein